MIRNVSEKKRASIRPRTRNLSLRHRDYKSENPAFEQLVGAISIQAGEHIDIVLFSHRNGKNTIKIFRFK